MKKEVDSETLKGLKEGKISSFESIYQYYSGRVYNFINSIVKDRILSKDLTQDVFMQIWDKRRGILCDGNFDSYIFTIARNRVYHYIKREMWIQQYFEAEAKEQGINAVSGKCTMFGNARTVIEDPGRCFMKLVAHAETRELIGAQLMCEHSSDMIGGVSQALANHMTVDQFLLAMRPHPSFEEAMTAALEDLAQKLG